jgi:hypothetical protein
MVTTLPLDPDTIVVAAAASGIAPSDLAASLATVQVATAAFCVRVAVVEAVLQ